MNTSEQLAYSVQGFCDAHGISRGMFYKLLKDGLAPRFFKVGSRTLISNEDAQKWRDDMGQRTKQVI